MKEAIIELITFIAENAGATDDFPMEITFDNDETAEKFLILLKRAQESVGLTFDK